MHYNCGCDISIHSVVDVSDGILTDMPQHGKLSIFLPPIVGRIPIKHQQRLPLLLMLHLKGETPSVPDTPHFAPDQGDPSPDEPAIGTATRIVAKERMTQMPPLLSRLILITQVLKHVHIIKCTTGLETQIVTIARGLLVFFITIRLLATDIFRFSRVTFPIHTPIG